MRVARTYVGVPWRHMGRSRRGLDCVGLLIVAGEESGCYGGGDVSGYARVPDGVTLKKMLAEKLTILPVNERSPGDVALYAGGPTGWPVHVGIIGDGPRQTLIHAYADYGRVVEHDLMPRLHGGRLVGAYRFPGRTWRN